MKTFILALDLIDDPSLILEYERWHASENVWREIIESIKEAGITNMQIFRTGNRLVMIMETIDGFDPESKAEKDAQDPKVQAWEKLMWGFQQALPWAKPGEKWVRMNQIFQLT